MCVNVHVLKYKLLYCTNYQDVLVVVIGERRRGDGICLSDIQFS